MDILTERGKETLEQERDAVAVWLNHYPDLTYNETPKGRPADIDAILTNKRHEIIGVVETKCRVSMSLREFDEEYESMWLVTFDKILRGIDVSNALQVPLVGFLYFPHDITLLVKNIYCPRNGLQTPMEVRNTKTQRTVNGGTIMRDNAYIDMSKARRLT